MGVGPGQAAQIGAVALADTGDEEAHGIALRMNRGGARHAGGGKDHRTQHCVFHEIPSPNGGCITVRKYGLNKAFAAQRRAGMSYIDQSLGAGETVIIRAHFHWLYSFYAWAMLLLPLLVLAWLFL